MVRPNNLEVKMTPQVKPLKETEVLRDVPPQNAFFFYRAIGAPTGAAARNLSDFAGVLGSIDIASIQFHIGRGDFGNWIKMLGDAKLARQVTLLKEKNIHGEQLRVQLLDTVKARIGELQKAKP